MAVCICPWKDGIAQGGSVHMSMEGRYSTKSQGWRVHMSMEGRYSTRSQGWRDVAVFFTADYKLATIFKLIGNAP